MTADPLAKFADRDRETNQRIGEAIDRLDPDHGNGTWARSCWGLSAAYTARAEFWDDVREHVAGEVGGVTYSAVRDALSGAQEKARRWEQMASVAEQRDAERAVA